jgi:hypothetical protein
VKWLSVPVDRFALLADDDAYDPLYGYCTVEEADLAQRARAARQVNAQMKVQSQEQAKSQLQMQPQLQTEQKQTEASKLSVPLSSGSFSASVDQSVRADGIEAVARFDTRLEAEVEAALKLTQARQNERSKSTRGDEETVWEGSEAYDEEDEEWREDQETNPDHEASCGHTLIFSISFLSLLFIIWFETKSVAGN